MADEAAFLKFLIEIGVTGTDDLKAAKDLFSETKDGAAGLSQSMPEGWAGMDKYKTAMQGAGGGAEGLHEKLHGLRALMRGAGPEAAEFGHLLHFAFNPAFLGAALGAAGLEAYFHWQEKIEERNKQFVEDMQKVNEEQHRIVAIGGTVTEGYIAQNKATAELRASWHGLAEQIRRTEESQKVFDAQAMDAQQTRLAAHERENSLLVDKIKLLEKLGQITPEESDLQTGQIEHQKKLDEIQAEIDKKKTEAQLAQNDRNTLANTAGDFSEGAVEAKRKAAESARTAADRSAEAMKGDPAEIARLEGIVKAQHQRAKAHPLEWNEALDAENQARDQIKVLQKQMENARSLYPGQEQAAASTQKDYESTKGLHEKFTGLDQHIRELNQGVIDAQTAAPGKVADENTHFVMDQLSRMLTDSKLSRDQIIEQGAGANEDIKNLMLRGYGPDRIKQEGEDAQRKKDAGQKYDGDALNRLGQLSRDQTAQNRLNILIHSFGDQQRGLIDIVNNHQHGMTTLNQEIVQMKTLSAAMLRWQRDHTRSL